MSEDFEELMKQTRPAIAPDFKSRIIQKASECWAEENVESALENCRSAVPGDKSRAEVLNAAKNYWQAKSPSTLRYWLFASAAVLLFGIVGNWYDAHQNASLNEAISRNSNGKNKSTEIILNYGAELQLNIDTRFLAGGGGNLLQNKETDYNALFSDRARALTN